MDRPLITIGITCCNDGRLARHCLESVFSQSYPNFEVIVVDDCSTDDSLAQLEPFKDRLWLITHVQGSGGCTAGRREVIENAHGDYVCHLDAEDFLAPDFITAHVEAVVSERSLDWVAGDIILTDAEGRETGRSEYRNCPTDPAAGLRRGFATAGLPVAFNGLFSTKFLRENGLTWFRLPRTESGSDVFTCVKYLECNPRIRLLPYAGLYRRIHGGCRGGRARERALATVDLKEYYAAHHNETLYLPHPGFWKYEFGGSNYLALKYYLLAAEFYRAMHAFRMAEHMPDQATTEELRAAREVFQEPIVRYADMSVQNEARFKKELSLILHDIGYPTGNMETSGRRDHRQPRHNASRAADWHRVLSSSPQSLEALNGLADEYYRRGENDRARQHAAAAVALAPRDPQTLNTAGLVARASGLDAEAEVLFKRALVGDPRLVEAHRNLCELWGRMLPKLAPDAQRRRDLLQTVRWLGEYAADGSRTSILRENRTLRDNLLAQYRRRWQAEGLRVLLHRPPVGGRKCLMDNWAEVLTYAGVPTRVLSWGERTAPAFTQFRPDVFVTTAAPEYISRLDNDFIKRYRAAHDLLIGHITTFEHEFPPCDFLITLQRIDRLSGGETPVLSLPHACNPIQHYMRPGAEVWDYIFVGTNSERKVERTKAYLLPIVNQYSGVLAGAKWDMGLGELSAGEVAELYSFARVCPNYGAPTPPGESDEVNDRTFIIPACGGFELTDRPSALGGLFAKGELAAAESPAEYREMFEHYVRHPEERWPFVRAGMRRVYREYTLFHVLERFVEAVIDARGGRSIAKMLGALDGSEHDRPGAITWADRFI